MKASVIFDPEPESWGFRGDPYFWRYLKDRLSGTDLPIDPDRLESFIRREHFRLTGTELSPSSMGISELLAHGGMTSGGISGKWWCETGIPILHSRCEEIDRASE